MGENYVLELKDIVKLFPGVRALDGMSLHASPGKVHVICGENGAGKSTLMKVISGEYVAEEGEVIYKGRKLGKRTIMETMEMGISMIHQEMNPIKAMTVAENIYLGREPKRGLGMVDFKKMNQMTQELLDRLNIPYEATQKMGELSIAGQQLVEIAKAISMNASVVIMDEPTSAIADAEVEVLFRQIEELKAEGVAVLYITHKMDEIFRIADEISVIRDGTWVDTRPASEMTADEVITLMVGRKVENLFSANKAEKGEVVLEVRGLNRSGQFHDINFSVRKGEIVGFSGLVGSGRSEVMRAVFGLEAHDSGEILVHGEARNIRSSVDGIENGIAMVSEDRRTEGIIPIRSVRENVSLAFIDKLSRFGLVKKKEEIERADKMIQQLNVKTPSPKTEIRTLSGGNQQKAILGKWLLGNPDILILDEPTRGIDVGSKAEIHQLMCDCAEKGVAVVMISSELPEVIGMSDRIYVMREGTISGELCRSEATQESIMRLAT